MVTEPLNGARCSLGESSTSQRWLPDSGCRFFGRQDKGKLAHPNDKTAPQHIGHPLQTSSHLSPLSVNKQCLWLFSDGLTFHKHISVLNPDLALNINRHYFSCQFGGFQSLLLRRGAKRPVSGTFWVLLYPHNRTRGKYHHQPHFVVRKLRLIKGK